MIIYMHLAFIGRAFLILIYPIYTINPGIKNAKGMNDDHKFNFAKK